MSFLLEQPGELLGLPLFMKLDNSMGRRKSLSFPATTSKHGNTAKGNEGEYEG